MHDVVEVIRGRRRHHWTGGDLVMEALKVHAAESAASPLVLVVQRAMSENFDWNDINLRERVA